MSYSSDSMRTRKSALLTIGLLLLLGTFILAINGQSSTESLIVPNDSKSSEQDSGSVPDGRAGVPVDSKEKSNKEKNGKLKTVVISSDKNTEQKPLEPCTVKNQATNQFFDLRSLAAIKRISDGKTTIEPQPWVAKGFDYGGNFTIGVCSSPITPNPEKDDDFTDVSNKTMVGAYFSSSELPGKVALGQASSEIKFRGRKMVMEYKDGDFCPGSDTRRRSALMLFTCDRTIQEKAKVSYIGSADDCAYFLEVRTIHACGAAPTNESVGLVWIVLLIGAAAGITFFGGGILYKLFQKLGLGQAPNRL